MRIYLTESASTQPRTRPSKFAIYYEDQHLRHVNLIRFAAQFQDFAVGGLRHASEHDVDVPARAALRAWARTRLHQISSDPDIQISSSRKQCCIVECSTTKDAGQPGAVQLTAARDSVASKTICRKDAFS